MTSKDPTALLKHLPEATKAMLLKGGSGSLAMFGGLSGISEMLGANGGKVNIPETGPTLLSVEDPRTQAQAEVTIESDDYRGDEDDMLLAFHETKNGGEEQFFPQLGRVVLNMKLENGAWKFAEVGYNILLKLDDPKFLEAMSRELQQTQQQAGQGMAEMSVQAVSLAEAAYLRKHGTYSCSLDELSANTQSSGDRMSPKLAAEMLKPYAYALTLSDCTASGFKVAAAPAPAASTGNATQDGTARRPAHPAYCSDQTAMIRSSPDGKAQTCFTSGRQAADDLKGKAGTGILVPAH